jgi:hypothetical protein
VRVRGIFLFVAFGVLACASATGVAPDPAISKNSLEDQGAQTRVSRARFPLRMKYREAVERFQKGTQCGGADSPETLIGWPDRRNQMQVAGARIVTYGFRFREGTLLIRCRADVVEVTRSLN